MSNCLFKASIHRTKAPWRFWVDTHYVLRTLELNENFKPKNGCWIWLVDFESDRFINNMGDLEDFELADNFNLHTIFGEIRSDDFVEKREGVNLTEKEKENFDIASQGKEIVVEEFIGLDCFQSDVKKV